jgi:hypothetical protein
MNKNYFLMLILLIVETYSCKKSTNDNSIQHTGPDIYAAGYDMSQAVYWKNGSEVFLNKGTSASSIFISGNDVYTAGIVIDGAYYAAGYWKNDSLVTLTDGTIRSWF